MLSKRWPNGWTRPETLHNVTNKYGWRVSFPISLWLGERTDIGFGTYIQAKYGVTIGDETQIGGHCLIYSYDSIGDRRGPVIIGRACKIGSFSLILPGAVIPDGTFIKAHSIVKPI